MKLISLQIGKPQTIQPSGTEEWWDKEWTTAFIKTPVPEPVWLGYEGLNGDGQADARVHGGVDRAICVYPGEHYSYWRDTFQLPELSPGAFGENFTTFHLPESEVCIGDVFSIGDAQVQVSQPRQPCWKPSRRWKIKDLALQIEQTGRTGFYFRILRHGMVQTGQAFVLLERTHTQWTVARCNEIFHHRKNDLAAALALSECPALSGFWKDHLFARHRSGLKTAPLG